MENDADNIADRQQKNIEFSIFHKKVKKKYAKLHNRQKLNSTYKFELCGKPTKADTTKTIAFKDGR